MPGGHDDREVTYLMSSAATTTRNDKRIVDNILKAKNTI